MPIQVATSKPSTFAVPTEASTRQTGRPRQRINADMQPDGRENSASPRKVFASPPSAHLFSKQAHRLKHPLAPSW